MDRFQSRDDLHDRQQSQVVRLIVPALIVPALILKLSTDCSLTARVRSWSDVHVLYVVERARVVQSKPTTLILLKVS